MDKRSSIISVLNAVMVLMTVTVGITAAADVTQNITYQGKLTDAAGNPLTGTYTVTFRLYNVSSGGTSLATSTQSVQVTNGLLTTPVTFDPGFFDGQALWLGVKVGADAEMTPRQELRPVPYALGLRPGVVGASFRTFSAGTLTHQFPGVNVSTAFAYNPGVRITTTAGMSEGVNISTSSYWSPGIVVSTYGGMESPGIVVSTWYDDSPGMRITTHGSDSEGLRISTSSSGSEGMYITTSGGTGSSGIVVSTSGFAGNTGMSAFTSGESSPGISGKTSGINSYGVTGTSEQSYGLYAHTNRSDQKYGIYTPDYLYAKGTQVPSSDIAEYMPVADDVTPGTVLVIGEDGKLRISTSAYDTRVAGIVSTSPGVTLGIKDYGNHGEQIIAVAGRVPCNADATHAPIHAGDLLTTADNPGYAMKAMNPQIGTILGKAMGTLESGTGTIEVLVTLQ
jgi:hypothetical protein